MGTRFRAWWQQIKHHAFIATGILVALLVLIAFIFFAYRFGWSGTGFLNKTVWDWLQLLIIPLALAIIAVVFQLANARTERQIAKERYEHDQQIALDKQRQDLLQTYLDRMSELLLKEKLRSSADDAEVRDVARARTLTVLPQLDAQRKGSLIKFLSESKLLGIISLDDADLSGADLGYINLSGLDLGEANLSGADLGDANLTNTILTDTNLSGAILWYANLSGAQVTEEQLKTVKSLKDATMPDGSKHP